MERNADTKPRELLIVEGLAKLLDQAIKIPGTPIRFGLDAILGLFPGVGDAIGALLSGYIIWIALRLGVKPFTAVRMAFNVAIDTIIGAVPFFGDLFDVAWNANIKNVALLKGELERGSVGDLRSSKHTSQLVLLFLTFCLFSFLILIGVLVSYVAKLIVGLF